jgi:hypothetical protein
MTATPPEPTPQPTRAQIEAAEALEEMRVRHWDRNRWHRSTFETYTEMCIGAGVKFDPDMCDEMGVELARARHAGEVAGDERAARWLKEHDGEWCCCTCGPSKTSRAEWCDRGCGSDYNAMIRIDHWRMGRLFKLAAAIRSLAPAEKEPGE